MSLVSFFASVRSDALNLLCNVLKWWRYALYPPVEIREKTALPSPWKYERIFLLPLPWKYKRNFTKQYHGNIIQIPPVEI